MVSAPRFEADLMYFSEKFGAEPWFAIKFFHEPWYFFTAEDMQETGASYVVTVEQAKSRALTFDQLLQ